MAAANRFFAGVLATRFAATRGFFAATRLATRGFFAATRLATRGFFAVARLATRGFFAATRFFFAVAGRFLPVAFAARRLPADAVRRGALARGLAGFFLLRTDDPTERFFRTDDPLRRKWHALHAGSAGAVGQENVGATRPSDT
jgi:hypothetical protein